MKRASLFTYNRHNYWIESNTQDFPSLVRMCSWALQTQFSLKENVTDLKKVVLFTTFVNANALMT